tara:strand:- start:48 stop:575 length:528 start_codon:yes stop_codon:yes gene_type:complete
MKTINLTNNEEVKKRNKSENINNELKKNNIYLINYINNPNLQINLINNLYLDNDFPEKKYILDELKIKLNSYKQQDKKKYNESNNLITLDNIIEKLVCSKLKCYYCKKNLLLFFEKVRDNDQWTLDRLNNYDEHSNDNTIICCLECNLQRRRKNSDKFLFTKQLENNIIKIKKME